MNHQEVLRAELERLFELDDLKSLSLDVLGFDPERVGGTATKGSFARSLVEYCEREDTLVALIDAVIMSGHDLPAQLAELASGQPLLDAPLNAGVQIGSYQITRKLAEAPSGISYHAKSPEGDVRLKVLSPEAERDRRGLARYLVHTRLAAKFGITGLPQLLFAGKQDGHQLVAHAYTDGQPLSARVGRTGPMHINEARPILAAVGRTLQALHQNKLAHGALNLDSVLSLRAASGEPQVYVLDGGVDHLKMRHGIKRFGLSMTGGHPKTMAPEQIRGCGSDARSDAYSLGAMMFELLTGKPLFDGEVIDMAIGHLSKPVPTPSTVAPRGWITPDLDEAILGLLQKDPSARTTLTEFLARLDDLGRSRKSDDVSAADLEALEQKLLANPTDAELALSLESAVGRGASAERVGQAFRLAASMMDDAEQLEDKKRLLLRSARLLESRPEGLEKAEAVYLELVELEPTDAIALAGLEELRRRLGKNEELIEMLLARAEKASSPELKARAMAEIGRIYLKELKDTEQAVVAFSQAYCDAPSEEYALEVERACGNTEQLWAEALSALGETCQEPSLAAETRTALLLKAGIWYRSKVNRPDLALPCFQAVLATEPANDAALSGLSEIYRRAQQWQDLGMILTLRGNAAATPALARDLRTEAGELAEIRLGDLVGARAIYEQVLGEDPSHEKAAEALARILEKSGDYSALAALLEKKLEASSGSEAARTLCHLGELQEDRLGDIDAAIASFKRALSLDADNLDALRGLERIYTKQGKYRDLVENLERQVVAAATPKQRVALLERIAAIYEEEFLDHAEATRTLEKALELDPSRAQTLATLVRYYRVLERWEDAASCLGRQIEAAEDKDEKLQLSLALGRLLTDHMGAHERALRAYEQVLDLAPEHAVALEAIARLRELTGDAEKALEAILSLADKAETPEARAEQYLRAARLLEARGNRDQAIDQYRAALEANPGDRAVAALLRAAYVARGDFNAAIEMLERELDAADSDRVIAKLSGELARLLFEKKKDEARAEGVAERALRLDQNNFDALLVLGELCFAQRRFVEASAHLGRVVERADSLDRAEATELLMKYVDALSQAGSTEAALSAMDVLLRLAPNNLEALTRVAQVTFEHGSAGRAVELLGDLLARFGKQMSEDEKSVCLYRLGEASRKSGDLPGALRHLRAALELDPAAQAPLESLALTLTAQEKWPEVVKIRNQQLDHAEGESRIQLLLEVGELYASKLNDRARATRSFVMALEEKPDDRRILTRLMQLYSEEKDWSKLVEVVEKLADFVEDPGQKVKYLLTCALLTDRELGNKKRAREYFENVLELEPSNLKALTELEKLARAAGDFHSVEDYLNRRVLVATDQEDTAELLKTYDALGEVLEKHLVDRERAAEAYEHAYELDRDNTGRQEKLSKLYLAEPQVFAGKAIALHEQLLSQNPFRHDSYKALRKVYTALADQDASFGLCQVLSVLKLADAEETRLYTKKRAETAAPAQAVLREEDWQLRLYHGSLNPLLTSIFALIEPAVVKARAQSLNQLGLSAELRIDPAANPAPMAQTIHYASGVLGLAQPECYANPADLGGLSWLYTQTPSLSLGQVAMSPEVPPQVAAFVAARQLASARPGLYLRHFVQTGTALKAWLFAAIKLTSPAFPVATDIEGAVAENLSALRQHLPVDSKDHLSSVVSKLIQSGTALDLKRWVMAVDLTVDRVGFTICHDLDTASQVVRADASSQVPADDRFRELICFAASKNYFELRSQLGITVEA